MTMDPEELLDDALMAYDAATSAAAGRPPEAARLDELGALARSMASARLLARGDITGFRAALDASGRHRRELLGIPLPAPGAPSRRYFAKSRSAGLVDALVAESDQLAGSIIAASPRGWLEGVEYEEDALQLELLELLCLHDPRAPDPDVDRRRDAIAARLDALEARGPSSRTELLLAIHALSGSGVLAAFERWLDERAAIRAARPDALARAPWRAFVDDAIFFEGLALDRLVRGVGMTGVDDEPGMPRLLTRSLAPWSYS